MIIAVASFEGVPNQPSKAQRHQLCTCFLQIPWCNLSCGHTCWMLMSEAMQLSLTSTHKAGVSFHFDDAWYHALTMLLGFSYARLIAWQSAPISSLASCWRLKSAVWWCLDCQQGLGHESQMRTSCRWDRTFSTVALLNIWWVIK